MGVRIIEGHEGGTSCKTVAVLFCSVTSTAFGPLFDDYDDAERFLDYLRGFDPPADPRQFPEMELQAYFVSYRKEHPSVDA